MGRVCSDKSLNDLHLEEDVGSFSHRSLSIDNKITTCIILCPATTAESVVVTLPPMFRMRNSEEWHKKQPSLSIAMLFKSTNEDPFILISFTEDVLNA